MAGGVVCFTCGGEILCRFLQLRVSSASARWCFKLEEKPLFFRLSVEWFSDLCLHSVSLFVAGISQHLAAQKNFDTHSVERQQLSWMIRLASSSLFVVLAVSDGFIPANLLIIGLFTPRNYAMAALKSCLSQNVFLSLNFRDFSDRLVGELNFLKTPTLNHESSLIFGDVSWWFLEENLAKVLDLHQGFNFAAMMFVA